MSEAKRVFKSLDGNEMPQITFIRPSKLAEDDFTGVVVEGEFIGTMPNKFNEDKPHFKIKKDDGSLVVLNSCGSVAKQMEKVKEGDYIQVSYNGQKKIEDGKLKGKIVHQFNILKA